MNLLITHTSISWTFRKTALDHCFLEISLHKEDLEGMSIVCIPVAQIHHFPA